MAITLQSGLRNYSGNITKFTGMAGGLTPDIHTLRSLNPITTNRVLIVMQRGPLFLQHYFATGGGAESGSKNAYDPNSLFAIYKHMIEYVNTGIQPNIGEASLAPALLQGGFAGRSVNFPTVQNESAQSLTVEIPELIGRPSTTFHNMWMDGIADPITGLTHYHGMVAGSVGEVGEGSEATLIPQRVFAPTEAPAGHYLAFEPSPAWEVAEFLIIAIDRSGAQVDGAIMGLGAFPTTKIGRDLFTSNATGSSSLQKLSVAYNLQFIESTYVNDLATRYVQQFAIFGNSMNLNPGAGDAYFTGTPMSPEDRNERPGGINSPMMNQGWRPQQDAVQSGLGNAPVLKPEGRTITSVSPERRNIVADDHNRRWGAPYPEENRSGWPGNYSDGVPSTRATQLDGPLAEGGTD